MHLVSLSAFEIYLLHFGCHHIVENRFPRAKEWKEGRPGGPGFRPLREFYITTAVCCQHPRPSLPRMGTGISGHPQPPSKGKDDICLFVGGFLHLNCFFLPPPHTPSIILAFDGFWWASSFMDACFKQTKLNLKRPRQKVSTFNRYAVVFLTACLIDCVRIKRKKAISKRNIHITVAIPNHRSQNRCRKCASCESLWQLCGHQCGDIGY